jgi:hypothetical protein
VEEREDTARSDHDPADHLNIVARGCGHDARASVTSVRPYRVGL